MATPNIVPRADSEGGIGTASKYWGSAYIDLIYVGAGKMGRDEDNLLDFSTDDRIKFEVGGSVRTQMTTTAFFPNVNDGYTLGAASYSFSDLFLADGGVINFNNGNVTLTHSSGRLTLPDSVNLGFGASNDLDLYHNATNSFVENWTGNLYIRNNFLDGDIKFESDDGSGGLAEYFRVDGGQEKTLFFNHSEHQDNVQAQFGNGGDMYLQHDGADSVIINKTGNLTISNQTNDGDIIFKSDDGTGGTLEYFRLDGGNVNMITSVNNVFVDNKKAIFGSGADLEMYHDGSNSYIHNNNDGGHLYIQVDQTDKDILFQSDDGSGNMATYFYLDGSSATHDGSATTGLYTNWPDKSAITLGNEHDLHIKHNGTDTTFDNYVGDLKFVNYANDKDIVFQSDDGSGGIETYFFLDGSASSGSPYTVFPDNSLLAFGTGNDMVISHNATNSLIQNNTGDLYIMNQADGKDIIFQSDDGNGGTETYFKLDGSMANSGNALRYTVFPDDSVLLFGDGSDLRIYHDGTDSYIHNDTGDLRIENDTNSGDIVFRCDNGSGGLSTYFRVDGGLQKTIFPDNQKLSFGSSGDLDLYHDGSNSRIENSTGDLQIQNFADGKDIKLMSDDGSGGTSTYLQLDGSEVSTKILTQKVIMSNLPTSDPSNAGQLWIDTSAGRVLKVSAG